MLLNIDNPIAFVSEDTAKEMGLYEVEEDVEEDTEQEELIKDWRRWVDTKSI